MAREMLPEADLPPPLGRSHRELQIEATKEEAGKKSAVQMLIAAARGFGLSADPRLADHLVLYGTEGLLAAMIEKLTSEPAARLNIRALAREAGIEVPEHAR